MIERVWNVEIVFTEDSERTRADAMLSMEDARLHGFGRSRRNPRDPDIPVIGEEVAAARALTDLAQQLLERAADIIEAREGGVVRIHG